MKTFQIQCSGYSVMADWYEGSHKDKILLALIGWSSNRKKYDDILPGLQNSTGGSELVFDYSGHGDSPFALEETRPAQHFLEVITVFDWLVEYYPNTSISVMGTSYGGFLATQLTKYRAFERLVLRAPAIYPAEVFYTKWRDITDRHGIRTGYRKNKEALAKHPLLARASGFRGKTLVVVHENDELVPRETTDAYIKAFNAEVYEAKDFKHSIDPQTTPRAAIVAYEKTIGEWLNQV